MPPNNLPDLDPEVAQTRRELRHQMSGSEIAPVALRSINVAAALLASGLPEQVEHACPMREHERRVAISQQRRAEAAEADRDRYWLLVKALAETPSVPAYIRDMCRRALKGDSE